MRISRIALTSVAILAFAAPLTACSSGETATETVETAIEESAVAEPTIEVTEPATAAMDASPVDVVATTTVLGDVASKVVACANPDSTVTTLMPIGADPHDFAPSSEQVAQMVSSQIVIANGLGLEAGLDDALDNAASDGATVIEIAERVDPIPFGADAHAGEHGDEHANEEKDADHGHGSEDPHFWLDMNRMASAAQIIGDELAVAGGQGYADCGAQVADEIRAAEADVRGLLESVPTEQRVLVTDHEALGYLAEAYGYEIAGTVIPAGTTLAEPSSADLAELVNVMRAEGVRVIFANTANPSAVADAVAAEVGGDVTVVPLFVESLGEPGSGAEDYISMMRANAELISGALTR